MTWACTWKTDCPADAPVLSTSRNSAKPQRGRHLGGTGHEPSGKVGVGGREGRDVAVVLPRYDEHVGRRLRSDVSERDDVRRSRARSRRVSLRRRSGRTGSPRPRPWPLPSTRHPGLGHPRSFKTLETNDPTTPSWPAPAPLPPHQRWTSAGPSDRAEPAGRPADPILASSSWLSPPSGPTTSTTRPARGRAPSPSAVLSGTVAPSCSTHATSAPATTPVMAPRSATAATTGHQVRRDCLAASRATASHLARPRSTLSPLHLLTQRSACHGTISSTPTSVSRSTASSPRSPFGHRLHDGDVQSGSIGRARRH